jgi:hypothetical protein
MKYLNLDKPLVAAFLITIRDKDYGGIHLAVPVTSINLLLLLADELKTFPQGHSRNLVLLSVPRELPYQILDRAEFVPLHKLRIATAPDNITYIHVEDKRGNILLSPGDLLEFKRILSLLTSSSGDLLIAGASGEWSDRLWFWPVKDIQT